VVVLFGTCLTALVIEEARCGAGAREGYQKALVPTHQSYPLPSWFPATAVASTSFRCVHGVYSFAGALTPMPTKLNYLPMSPVGASVSGAKSTGGWT